MTGHSPENLTRRKAEWIGWAVVVALFWALLFVGGEPVETNSQVGSSDDVSDIGAIAETAHVSDVF